MACPIKQGGHKKKRYNGLPYHIGRPQQVVKVILHKTALSPQTDGSIVFTRWCQCAFPCGQTGATWRMRLNFCFLLPTRVHNLNGKSTRSAVLAQLTAESPYTYNGLFFPQNCPFRWGYLDPHFPAPPES